MGQHGVPGLDQAGTKITDAVIGSDILGVYILRLREQCRSGIRTGSRQTGLHPFQCPEQVHGRGAGGGQHPGIRIQPGAPVPGGLRLALPGGQHHAVGRRNTDGRGTAHHHIVDRRGYPGGILQVQVMLLERQAALIEQAEAVPLPADGPD